MSVSFVVRLIASTLHPLERSDRSIQGGTAAVVPAVRQQDDDLLLDGGRELPGRRDDRVVERGVAGGDDSVDLFGRAAHGRWSEVSAP